MTLTKDWDNVAFHDARVVSLEESSAQLVFELDGVHLMPAHPDNGTAAPRLLRKTRLVFERPCVRSVRAYDSRTEQWRDLQDREYMRDIAEVVIEAGLWKLTGFAPDGRWLEWEILAKGTVRLEEI
ncbi:MAG TPA: hypothetical protein VH877_29250 [Polyangia bacterium]|jgi:hypothetical protein|nr:hypothetical protein [Polyangia bacterium]